jgi:hypothetical protein
LKTFVSVKEAPEPDIYRHLGALAISLILFNLTPTKSMAPRKSHRQSDSSDGVDVGLELGSTVLKTLETVAKVCPVPGLSEAAKLALQITDMVKVNPQGDFNCSI